MDPDQDSAVAEPEVPLLRLDAGHRVPALHPGDAVLRSRRVRQVLAGAASARQRQSSASCHADATIRLRRDERSEGPRAVRAGGPVLRRFRDNFCTLSHIACDPLLFCADEGSVFSDLRETLCLTESALRQFDADEDRPVSEPLSCEAILAIAHVVEERVDRLFDRLEQLTAMRQTLLRMSGILEGVACGIVPSVHEFDELATGVVDSAFADEQAVTLIDPDSKEQAVRVAAHAMNVAQVATRLALTVPAWRDECALAADAALVQDLGMMQVPVGVLDSPNLLTAAQWALVHNHPSTSASLVRQIRGHDERLVQAVNQHHERLDGSGYPQRLHGDSVESVARLLAVADTYVGIQSHRAHRPAMSAKAALEEIDRAAAAGRLDRAWACRLAGLFPTWLKIPVVPEPPSRAPAVSALAA